MFLIAAFSGGGSDAPVREGPAGDAALRRAEGGGFGGGAGFVGRAAAEAGKEYGGGFVEHGEGGADDARVGFDEGPDAPGDEVPCGSLGD